MTEPIGELLRLLESISPDDLTFEDRWQLYELWVDLVDLTKADDPE